jgi:hypothetical protein
MLPRPEWPYAIGDAIAVELYRWSDDTLAAAYGYADGMGETGPVGPQDWPVLRRLARADKLTYRDEGARELAKSMVALGMDG